LVLRMPTAKANVAVIKYLLLSQKEAAVYRGCC
jgi:hypothetical protein